MMSPPSRPPIIGLRTIPARKPLAFKMHHFWVIKSQWTELMNQPALLGFSYTGTNYRVHARQLFTDSAGSIGQWSSGANSSTNMNCTSSWPPTSPAIGGQRWMSAGFSPSISLNLGQIWLMAPLRPPICMFSSGPGLGPWISLKSKILGSMNLIKIKKRPQKWRRGAQPPLSIPPRLYV